MAASVLMIAMASMLHCAVTASAKKETAMFAKACDVSEL
jgi:hypothetical protein